MRVESATHRVAHAGPLAAVVLLAALCSIAIGDEPASLTVSNLTPHRVDIVMSERSFRNIAPGASAAYTAAGTDTVRVKVTYSAGQGIEGSAERSFVITSFQAAGVAHSGGGSYLACSMGDGVIWPREHPMQWAVTADTLANR
jgi:hypothetical protein